MDRFEVRKIIDECFKNDNKYELLKSISFDDFPGVVNVLWEKMEDAEDSNIYKRELNELRDKIKALNNKSGLRVRCIKSLPDRKALVQLGPFVEEIVVSPSVDMSKLKAGVEVLVIGSGDGRVLAEIKGHDICDGRISKIHRILDPKRVVISDGNYESITRLENYNGE